MLERERLRLLGRMRMGRAGVHLELLQHLAAETVLRQHAADGTTNAFGGLGAQQIAVGLRPDATGVTRVVVDEHLVALVRREDDLVGVDHDDVIAGVDVGRERGLVLAAQQSGHLGRDATEHQPVSIDDIPASFDLAGFGGVGAHAQDLLESCADGTGRPQERLTTIRATPYQGQLPPWPQG